MGRVRRYKKFKAVDPCAKGKTKKDSDRDRNLPPDVKNHQAQRVNASQAREEGKRDKFKRKLPKWAKAELKETAKRVRIQHVNQQELKTSGTGVQTLSLEGKRKNEHMDEFNERVQRETAQMMKDKLKAHSSTVKRRKQYLDDKKMKNKLKKQGRWEEFKHRERVDAEGVAEEEESSAQIRRSPAAADARSGVDDRLVNLGHGRADDEEGATFQGSEVIRFGEVAHAPPQLSKLPKLRGVKDRGQSKPWMKPDSIFVKGRKDEGREVSDQDRIARNREMEDMRKRVQDAYSSLKSRRRAGQTLFVGSNL